TPPDPIPPTIPTRRSSDLTPSPNSNPGADAMASIISHELEEAVTDPDLNAWYSTQSGMENADKCAWTFGSESTASNGAKYNQTRSEEHTSELQSPDHLVCR